MSTAVPDKVVRIGLLQHACGADRRKNLARAAAMARQAARSGAKIIVTQELFHSTYFCQAEQECRFDLAEPVPGPTSQAMAQLARRHKVYIVASLFEKRAQGLHHNTEATM